MTSTGSWRRSRRRSASASAISSSARTTRRSKASCSTPLAARERLAGRGRDLHRRPDRRPHCPSARGREGVPPRPRGPRSGRDRRHPRPRWRADLGRTEPRGGRSRWRAPCAEETGASHALAVLIEVDDGPDRIDFGGSIHLAIASGEGSNRAARASMAAATGCGSVPSSSASTACAAICRASRSPSAPISSGFELAESHFDRGSVDAARPRRNGQQKARQERSCDTIAAFSTVGAA